jgi:hypothetical protein
MPWSLRSTQSLGWRLPWRHPRGSLHDGLCQNPMLCILHMLSPFGKFMQHAHCVKERRACMRAEATQVAAGIEAVVAPCAQADERTWEGPCWIPGFAAPLSKLPCFERVLPAASTSRDSAWHQE